MGIDDLLNLTVSVENSEENSYNSHVLLTYPAGLSYRKVTVLQVKHQFTPAKTFQFLIKLIIYLFELNQGRIECNSFDSEDGVQRGKTDCTIDKPIFKSNSKVGHNT